MAKLLISFFVVFSFSVGSYGQILNYDVIDSLDYAPNCFTLADFDDDGLDEILAGSDSGVVVIDPVSYDVLWYSQILPVYISAIGFFDVNGDGFKDVVAGTIFNGYWLNVIYGPDYTGLYTWGGYVNGVIIEIYNGVRPDTTNIIMITHVWGIYMIDTNTWDYTYYLKSFYAYDKAGYYFAEVIARWVEFNYSFTYYGEIQFYNSSFDSELFYRFRHFVTDESIRNFAIGTVSGLFLVNNPASYISAAYYENEGVIFEAFDEDLDFVSEIVSPITIPASNFYKSYIYRIDDTYSMIDDLLLVNTYGIRETSIVAVYYDGHYLHDWGYLVTDVPGFGKACIGNLYQEGEEVFVSKGRYKIYTSRFYLTMVNTEEEEIIYPESFMVLSVYPNPFNEQARIALKLDKSTPVNISVYDIAGRKVDEIYDGFALKGINRFSWAGNSLSSGVYFINARSEGYIVSSKVVLLK